MLTLSHCIVVIYGWVVDRYAFEVEISRVVCIEEIGGDIWYILTSEALAGDVNIVSLNRECINKILPEAHKLPSDIFLASNSYVSWGVSSADGLVNVDHIREIRPAVWILNGLVGSRLP